MGANHLATLAASAMFPKAELTAIKKLVFGVESRAETRPAMDGAGERSVVVKRDPFPCPWRSGGLPASRGFLNHPVVVISGVL